MTKFIPGLRLSELFFKEYVRPILRKHWPRLKYSAALVGDGSEILGFDTPMSMDHHWGPRALVFLRQQDHAKLGRQIRRVLSRELPYTFRGYSTHMPWDGDSRHMKQVDSGPIDHFVEVLCFESYFRSHLGIDPRAKLKVSDWLTFSEQSLLEVTRGKIFCDSLGELGKLRRKLRYYPKDVWRYMLGCQWTRIGQEEHLIGRAAHVGDDLGSRIIAARHVRDLMRLCFLMSRQYAPYPKWFGTSFALLDCAPALTPLFDKVLQGRSWRERQRHLGRVYERLVEMHNALGITKPLSTKATKFHCRPFIVVHGDRLADEIRKGIRSRVVRAISPAIGAVDQFSDSTDVLENPALCKKLRVLFE